MHPEPWKRDDLMAATGGELLSAGTAAQFSAIGIDSRRIRENELFVAIEGDVHDGHRFIADVLAQGVRGVVIDARKGPALPVADWRRQGIFCLAVPDTVRALGALAAFRRGRAAVSVVAITGSNGKTTTRAMTAAVLSRKYRVLATRGNFNNEIGLPLTLLGLCPEHQWAVVELGANHPGEINRLARICQPDIGVITNVASSHLEGLTSLEGVRQAKAELLDHLRPGGAAVLNADDPLVRSLKERAAVRVRYFGLSGDAEVRARGIRTAGNGVRFLLEFDGDAVEVVLATPARFMVANALAAAAVGRQLGMDADGIRAGLESFKLVQGRLNLECTANGVHIIDDTYNANPGSMQAALETLKDLKRRARAAFVAGEMYELGAQSAQLHRDVGAFAARSGVTRIFACGGFASFLADGAREAGMAAADVVTGSREELCQALRDWLRPGDWVLVKGSRAAAMERVVERLKEWGADDGRKAE